MFGTLQPRLQTLGARCPGGLRAAPARPAVPECGAQSRLVACCAHNGPRGEEEAEPLRHPELLNGEEPYTLPPGWANGYLGDRALHSDSWDFALDDGHVPAPSNLPTQEDPWTLNRKDVWHLTDQPGIDLLAAGPAALSQLRQVYVILFGVGERETEGIYSLRAFDKDGLPNETIILFEQEEDAQRYAGLLEATMDHTPNVCSIPPKELLDFCCDQGYRCRLEPAGSLLIPPDYNVNVTDWERSMRLRDGRFAVLDAEPEPGPSPSPRVSASGGGPHVAEPPTPASLGLRPANPQTSSTQQLTNFHTARPGPHSAGLARAALFGEGELEDIRGRLERLLSLTELPGEEEDGNTSSPERA